ncbi:hypothetical protein DN051_43955 (plasmid) [Streptomyces cadmiisoli]|uniref:HTH luxR-type domain-containing protein n=2 Tax=Streptomyces cadmiisoli TaxID=2184053 RepID=A0A2Z4JEK1_9ACTN|nr:hypothetical protein DN051_43955 [Streptomyces cadmiisoli]
MDQLAVVDAALSRAAASEGGCLIFRGGAGSGKTALLDAAAEQARAAGAAVVYVRASHAEHKVENNIAVRLVQALVDQFSERGREAFHGSLPSPVRVLTEGTILESATLGDDAAVQLSSCLMRAVVHEDRMTAVVIDNLHWVDRASMQWLRTLQSRLSTFPFIVVGSVCDGIAGTDTELLEEILVASDHVGAIAGLSEHSVATFFSSRLDGPVEASLTSAAFNMTAGNPLLLETLTCLIKQQGLMLKSKAAEYVSQLADSALAMGARVRSRRVSPTAFTVLRLTAAMGNEATLENIAALTGFDQVAVAKDCHALQQLGMLDGDCEHVTVAQPLLQNSLLKECPPDILHLLHRQAAQLLHSAGASPLSIARHLVLTPQQIGEDWVVDILFAAADRTLDEGNIANCLSYLQRLLIEPLPADGRAAVLTRSASIRARADLAVALSALRTAMTLSAETVYSTAKADLLALLTIGTALDQPNAGQRGSADAEVQQFIPTGLRVPCLLTHSSEAHKPQQGPPDLPADRLEVATLAAAMTAGGTATADDAARLAWSVLAGHSSSVDAVVGQALGLFTLFTAGQDSTVGQYVDCVEKQARALDVRPALALTLALRAGRAARHERDTNAAAELDEALHLGRRWDPGFSARLWHLLIPIAVETYMTLEDPSGLNRFVALVNEQDISSRRLIGAYLEFGQGQLRAAAGDPAGAVVHFLSCGRALTKSGVTNPALSPWRSRAALLLRDTGRTEEASDLAGKEVVLARKWGAPLPLARALGAQAQTSTEADALRAAREAVELLKRPRQGRILVSALREYGGLLAAAGEREAAQQTLQLALHEASQSEDPVLSQSLRQELIAVGGRPPRPRRTGLQGLTPSEARVASLAVRGMKNREIARTLFVGLRTVEIHLTNAYRKLGIEGREELSGALSAAHE